MILIQAWSISGFQTLNIHLAFLITNSSLSFLHIIYLQTLHEFILFFAVKKPAYINDKEFISLTFYFSSKLQKYI